jgi:hypothetical protein
MFKRPPINHAAGFRDSFFLNIQIAATFILFLVTGVAAREPREGEG